MWAMGAYTRMDQTARNGTTAVYLMRSALAPRTMPAVMRANVIWKIANSRSGTYALVPPIVDAETPLKNTLSRPPMMALPSEKARE